MFDLMLKACRTPRAVFTAILFFVGEASEVGLHWLEADHKTGFTFVALMVVSVLVLSFLIVEHIRRNRKIEREECKKLRDAKSPFTFPRYNVLNWQGSKLHSEQKYFTCEDAPEFAQDFAEFGHVRPETTQLVIDRWNANAKAAGACTLFQLPIHTF